MQIYFVAFDTSAEKFAFLKEVRRRRHRRRQRRGARTALDEIYQGRILAEAIDAGRARAYARSNDDRSSRRRVA